MTDEKRIEIQARHDAGETWAEIAGSKKAGRRLKDQQSAWRCRRKNKTIQHNKHVDDSEEGIRVVTAVHASTVEEVASELGLDLNLWRCLQVEGKPYQSSMKGPDDKPIVVNMWSKRMVFQRIPDLLVESLPPCFEFPVPSTPAPRGDVEATALILPDSQNGYRRDAYGHLVPMHDRRCWDLGVQMAERLQPTEIVLLGDMLDLPNLSLKYPTEMALRDITNPARAELRWWLTQLRQVAPNARIIWLEGNHEARLRKNLTERSAELGGLIDLETGEKFISIQTIMQMEGLHVEYVAPYGKPFWLWEDELEIMLHHGQKVGNRGGASVAKALIDDPVSTVFGHTHRSEIAFRVVPRARRPENKETIFSVNAGTFGRTDGLIPAYSHRVDWHQGAAIIRRVGDMAFPGLLPINNGVAILDGEVLVARDRLDDIERDLPEWKWRPTGRR